MKDSDFRKTRRNSSKKASKGGESSQIEVVTDQFAHIQPVQARSLEVKVYNGNFEKAFRAFRALVQKERVLSNYKERQSFEKASDKNRRKRNEAKRKQFETEQPVIKKKKPFRFRKTTSAE